MKRVFPFVLTVTVIACLTVIPGCLWKTGHSFAGPDLSTIAATSQPLATRNTGSARFEIVFPNVASSPSRNSSPLLAIRADQASMTPTVTFQLLLIDSENTASLTMKLARTVAVASDGSASTTFAAIPAVTVVGSIHINNGHIASYTDFQGCTDLVASQENVIFLTPSGSFTRPDLDAEIIRRLAASPSYQSQIIPQLATRVDAAMQTFVPSGDHVYDEALAAFLAFANALPKIVTGPTTFIVGQIVGAGETTITVASQGSMVNGLEIVIPERAFPGGANIRVDAATITSQTLPVDLTPISPSIQIDTGGNNPRIPMLLKVPAKIPPGMCAIAFMFYPATGELQALPIAGEASDSVTILVRNFDGSRNITANRFSGITEFQKSQIIIAACYLALIPDTMTGFQVNRNMWKEKNMGTYICSGGMCAGMSVTSLWCYLNRSIHGSIGSMNFEDDSGHPTPDILRDDSRAIRFASVAHMSLDWNYERMAKQLKDLPGVEDVQTYAKFRIYLHTLQRPQLIEIAAPATAIASERVHDLIVYGVKDNILYVADPNQPGNDTRTIELLNGHFTPYSLIPNGTDPDKFFTKFKFIGEVAMVIDESRVNDRWEKSKQTPDGNISEFPNVQLEKAKLMTDAYSYVPILPKDEDVENLPKLVVGLRNGAGGSIENDFGINLYQEGSPASQGLSVSAFTDGRSISIIPLSPGKNRLGFEIDLPPAGIGGVRDETGVLKNGKWTNFQWFTIWYLVAPGSLAAVPGDQRSHCPGSQSKVPHHTPYIGQITQASPWPRARRSPVFRFPINIPG
ncbi:MAG: hypothetical protein WA705_31610 [Candidatus Ozemobacteraceae bacterium]